MLSIVDNAVLQGLTYAPAVLGVAIAFRVLRYPDLTADGSFMLGGAVVASAANAGVAPGVAMLIAIVVGATAGATTAVLNASLGVNRLLSGILTTMACYSLGFRILGGRPNLGILDRETVFTLADRVDSSLPGLDFHPAAIAVCAIVTAVLACAAFLLLRSDTGLVLHAVGANESLATQMGRTPSHYRIVGLAAANGLVAVSGALLTARQGFADVNIGTGIIVVLIACLVIGEESARAIGWDPSAATRARVSTPAVGAVAYFVMFLFVLRASSLGWLPFQLEPTDLTFVSAALIVLVYLMRIRQRRVDELLPL
jgi:putative ABC transport system permease protein